MSALISRLNAEMETEMGRGRYASLLLADAEDEALLEFLGYDVCRSGNFTQMH